MSNTRKLFHTFNFTYKVRNLQIHYILRVENQPFIGTFLTQFTSGVKWSTLRATRRRSQPCVWRANFYNSSTHSISHVFHEKWNTRKETDKTLHQINESYSVKQNKFHGGQTPRAFRNSLNATISATLPLSKSIMDEFVLYMCERRVIVHAHLSPISLHRFPPRSCAHNLIFLHL